MKTMKFAVCLPYVIKPAIKGGGHLNTVRFARLLAEHADVQLVSYKGREEGIWYLPEVESRMVSEQYVLLLTWGPDVMGHVGKFYGRLPIVYYQQSMDQGLHLEPDIPVISMSKYMMAYAQLNWPANPQFYLPQALERDCRNLGRARDIDVLIVRRKQPSYIFKTLLPLLEEHCNVHVLDSFVPREDLFKLFNRAKVYLYAFAPQRTQNTSTGWRLMEGIATQVLEAMACGCTTVSDLRGGQAHFIEPWSHGYRLGTHSPEWDALQILKAVREYPQAGQEDYERYLQEHLDESAFHKRAACLIDFLSDYFTFIKTHPARIGPFNLPASISFGQKVQEKVMGSLYQWKRQMDTQL